LHNRLLLADARPGRDSTHRVEHQPFPRAAAAPEQLRLGGVGDQDQVVFHRGVLGWHTQVFDAAAVSASSGNLVDHAPDPT
jgi:hypothetical protein